MNRNKDSNPRILPSHVCSNLFKLFKKLASDMDKLLYLTPKLKNDRFSAISQRSMVVIDSTTVRLPTRKRKALFTLIL